jgi:capsid protein
MTLDQLKAQRETLPLGHNEQLANGNRIRQGIEFDQIGRRVAYHLLPPRWGWVDPLKDIRAEIVAMEAGLKSRTQASR